MEQFEHGRVDVRSKIEIGGKTTTLNNYEWDDWLENFEILEIFDVVLKESIFVNINDDSQKYLHDSEQTRQSKWNN